MALLTPFLLVALTQGNHGQHIRTSPNKGTPYNQNHILSPRSTTGIHAWIVPLIRRNCVHSLCFHVLTTQILTDATSAAPLALFENYTRYPRVTILFRIDHYGYRERRPHGQMRNGAKMSLHDSRSKGTERRDTYGISSLGNLLLYLQAYLLGMALTLYCQKDFAGWFRI